VDLHLPGTLAGPALVAAVRERLPPFARLVLLSADRDLLTRARELGADGALEKPFDIDDLLRLLDEHVQTLGAGTGAPIEH
jgi:CheY-like chemotaxis protein